MRDVYYTSEYYRLYEMNGEGDGRLFVYERGGDIGVYPFLKKRITGYALDRPYYDIQTAYGYGGPSEKLFHPIKACLRGCIAHISFFLSCYDTITAVELTLQESNFVCSRTAYASNSGTKCPSRNSMPLVGMIIKDI
ncbi:MAG: hypothetical protein LBQ58_08575 [Synergistaceae bacterium]|jgi:hypothetical protein|nr:hypothetical protein [Synergistaceae bacterium]